MFIFGRPGPFPALNVGLLEGKEIFGSWIGSEGSFGVGLVQMIFDLVDGLFHVSLIVVGFVGFTTLIVDSGSATCIVFGGGRPGNVAIFFMLDSDPAILKV